MSTGGGLAMSRLGGSVISDSTGGSCTTGVEIRDGGVS